jgi:hypothetical protein
MAWRNGVSAAWRNGVMSWQWQQNQCGESGIEAKSAYGIEMKISSMAKAK